MRIAVILLIASVASAQELPPEEGQESHPIHVTAEPSPPPSVVVEAPPPADVMVNVPSESVWWRVLELAVTLAGIVIAARMIIWQMRRQHESSSNLQRENAREELRAKIYSELRQSITSAARAETASSTYASMIPFNLKIYQNQHARGQVNAVGPPYIQERSEELIRRDSQMGFAVVDLITIFENYAIAVPQFEVFQAALNSAMHDARTAFTPMLNTLAPMLPVDMSSHLSTDVGNLQNSHYVPAPPDNDGLSKAQKVVDEYLGACQKLGCYIHDLRVEAQNTLLGELYPGQAAPLREPIDPSLRVVTAEHSDELIKFFREETAWGKSCIEAEERVRAQMDQANSAEE